MAATDRASLWMRWAMRFALSTQLLTPAAFGQLTGQESQFWHQNSTNIEGTNEEGDLFGSALVSGDFNSDGYPDLAIGAPGEAIGDITAAGVVQVLYGGEAGLQAPGNQLWSQVSPGIQGAAEEFDQFGSSLASGDFDGDGYDDLAVGSAGETVGSETGAGAVFILPGGPGGLSGNDSQVFTQNSAGIEDEAEEGDNCGHALAVGDFNHDGFDDLALGCPGEDLDEDDMGAVAVLYGSPSGLEVDGNQLWSQDSPGIDSVGETGDRFGSALAAGDFDNDGYSDLAAGAPDEEVNANAAAGVVNVLFGGMDGLTGDDSQVWVQGSGGVVDSADENDGFGSSLASGDFNADGFDDLAAGVPGEAVNGLEDAGAVSVIYGASAGLLAAGNQLWTQGSLGTDFAEFDDRFGSQLATGDFDNDGFDDLAVSAPSESIEFLPTIENVGAVHVVYGRPGGLSGGGTQLFRQDTAGVGGDPDEGDRFGTSMASGDFNLDGFDELAVGVVGDTVGEVTGTGSVNVLPGVRPGNLSSDLQRQVRAMMALQRLLLLLSSLL